MNEYSVDATFKFGNSLFEFLNKELEQVSISSYLLSICMYLVFVLY